jgi:hypothetical protein
VIECARVLGVEPEHPLEGLKRLSSAAVFQQRLSQRGERLQLVGIGLEYMHQHPDRRAG